MQAAHLDGRNVRIVRNDLPLFPAQGKFVYSLGNSGIQFRPQWREGSRVLDSGIHLRLKVKKTKVIFSKIYLLYAVY